MTVSPLSEEAAVRLSICFSRAIYFSLLAFVALPLTALAAVLQPPEITAPSDRAEFREARVIEFSWRPVPDAAAYRVVIARDREFKKSVFEDSNAVDTSFKLADLGYGTYFLRISSIDSKRFAGPFSEAISFVVVPPPPQKVREKKFMKTE